MGRYESGEGKVERVIKWCSGGVDTSSSLASTGFVHLSPSLLGFFSVKMEVVEQRTSSHSGKIKCWHSDRFRINLKAKDFQAMLLKRLSRKQFRRSV